MIGKYEDLDKISLNGEMTTITPVASIEASPSNNFKNTHRTKLSFPRFLSEKSIKIYQRRKNSDSISLLSPKKTFKLTRSPTTYVKEKEKMKNIPELLEKAIKAQKKTTI